MVAVVVPLVWLVAVMVDGQPEPPGIWVAGLGCAIVVCVVAGHRRHHDPPGGWREPPDPEEYVELVLSVVEEIPWGRVTSYGAIAAVVGGGPRQVGAVMSDTAARCPGGGWCAPTGRCRRATRTNARPHYLDEGTPCDPRAPST